ncbi:RsmE family RNA methyltransferase [Planctomicrobium sp. SH661]|uniref:RsmE family RNA methyltransferase n=1 Tax=Planctomicrobium sp. SH661 TaxID=3448124 RepID=UPI003F5B60E5
MPDRFYVPEVWSDRLKLDGPEAHHLGRVLRASPGDQIEIFDGRGTSATAIVEAVGKRTVTLKVDSARTNTPLPACEIVLAVAAPKGDRLAWMIEKVTELGVDRLIPITTTRSVVKPSDQKLHKGEQTVIAACKQSGRNRLLIIEELCPLTQLDRRVEVSNAAVWVGSPGAPAIATHSPNEDCSRKQWVAVIGPEGGLTAEEMELLQTWNSRSISLSPFVLRVETAAAAFATWMVASRMKG